MYPPNMWKRFDGLPVVILATWSLASCNHATRKAAAPVPEAEQEVSGALKELYMAASVAAPQSPAQQKVVLHMADKASNAKELLLTMRAAVGVFPEGNGPSQNQLHATVTAKMLHFATLDQLIEYASEYPVDPEGARPFVQRMFQLASENPDPREWYLIRKTAFHLRLGDLARQAQSKGDQLAGR